METRNSGIMDAAVWPMRLLGLLGAVYVAAFLYLVSMEWNRHEELLLGLPLTGYDAWLSFKLISTRRTRFGALETHSLFLRHMKFRLLAAILMGVAIAAWGSM